MTPSQHAPRAILQELGIRPLKRFGQNFLTDARVAERIAQACELTRNDCVVEIGPGTGALTAHLVPRARRVVAIEVDRALAGALARTLGDPPNLDVVQADVREVDLPAIARGDTARWTIAGNVPYLITTDIVTQIIDAGRAFGGAVLLVQREYAARLSARPGSAEYGALTVHVRQHAVVEALFTVGAACFYPQPDVSSAVVRLTLRDRPAQSVRSAGDLRAVVRAAFGMRRKMLGNALARVAVERGIADGAELCRQAGVDPRRRGETLDLPEFAALANALPSADLHTR
jgi:16S rRNA (adenine1518-N6/adenine1519-N6)-dimethyltransferase